MENLNEIKKDLYKNNPPALFDHIRDGVAFYFARKTWPDEVRFEIPVSEMSGADFLAIMDSKFLIRWIAII